MRFLQTPLAIILMLGSIHVLADVSIDSEGFAVFKNQPVMTVQQRASEIAPQFADRLERDYAVPFELKLGELGFEQPDCWWKTISAGTAQVYCSATIGRTPLRTAFFDETEEGRRICNLLPAMLRQLPAGDTRFKFSAACLSRKYKKPIFGLPEVVYYTATSYRVEFTDIRIAGSSLKP
jgi:hypothetical protein